jgi:hypothetical protein
MLSFGMPGMAKKADPKAPLHAADAVTSMTTVEPESA